ncbi:MAG: alanine dehydrogenase [Nanoarchaeota archaeon]|nr:alanine dehydrogenase [Nanoarchaeota archaeon]
MRIGTIKEIKNNENRVGLTPSAVSKLVKHGHDVYVQMSAGAGSGFADDEYAKAGAKVLHHAEDVLKNIDLLVKVKEPIPEEYPLLPLLKGKVLYTYLHLAACEKKLTEELMNNHITSIAYETIEDENGLLPCLTPMSEVAGVLAIQYGAQYLQKKYDGVGVTLGRVNGANVAETVVVGGGVVGRKAAHTAIGMGSNVTVFEANEQRAEFVRKELTSELCGPYLERLQVMVSKPEVLKEKLKTADLLVGAVLVHGAKAPRVVSEEMIKSMKKGAVVVDVAIDQGGCVWGAKPTSHQNPIYDIEGKVFCCITNMPGQAPLQSTQALTHSTVPYLIQMAEHGVIAALKADKGLAKGVNTHNGALVYKAVADALGLPFTPLVL